MTVWEDISFFTRQNTQKCHLIMIASSISLFNAAGLPKQTIQPIFTIATNLSLLLLSKHGHIHLIATTLLGNNFIHMNNLSIHSTYTKARLELH